MIVTVDAVKLAGDLAGADLHQIIWEQAPVGSKEEIQLTEDFNKKYDYYFEMITNAHIDKT